jgi:hypothetical protein
MHTQFHQDHNSRLDFLQDIVGDILQQDKTWEQVIFL